MTARKPAPDLATVRTRDDLELAVAWVLTFTPGDGAEVSDADLRSVMTAAESYREAGRREALMSLAADLDGWAGRMSMAAGGHAAYRNAAQLARQRAAGGPGATTDPSLVSLPAPGTSQAVSGPLSASACSPCCACRCGGCFPARLPIEHCGEHANGCHAACPAWAETAEATESDCLEAGPS